ncbi:hypothetical protein CEXT_697491 [Caerostris extrusa]|uniref:Uncharacterized protein n=1 Tax=Caerostris extrusa TaxID=172846 RepID=A0AAV4Y1E8_CAEEX|nr:hypothetical protein CEXT_697491 [Caerostris extrusa]
MEWSSKIRNANRARGDDPFIDRAGRFLRILISSPAFPAGELKRRGALTKRSPAKSIFHPQRMCHEVSTFSIMEYLPSIQWGVSYNAISCLASALECLLSSQ